MLPGSGLMGSRFGVLGVRPLGPSSRFRVRGCGVQELSQ